MLNESDIQYFKISAITVAAAIITTRGGAVVNESAVKAAADLWALAEREVLIFQQGMGPRC